MTNLKTRMARGAALVGLNLAKAEILSKSHENLLTLEFRNVR